MVKSERKFASDVTIRVPRSVLKDNDETSKLREKANVPLWDARHRDEGLE